MLKDYENESDKWIIWKKKELFYQCGIKLNLRNGKRLLIATVNILIKILYVVLLLIIKVNIYDFRIIRMCASINSLDRKERYMYSGLM